MLNIEAIHYLRHLQYGINLLPRISGLFRLGARAAWLQLLRVTRVFLKKVKLGLFDVCKHGDNIS